MKWYWLVLLAGLSTACATGGSYTVEKLGKPVCVEPEYCQMPPCLCTTGTLRLPIPTATPTAQQLPSKIKVDPAYLVRPGEWSSFVLFLEESPTTCLTDVWIWGDTSSSVHETSTCSEDLADQRVWRNHHKYNSVGEFNGLVNLVDPQGNVVVKQTFTITVKGGV